MDDKLVDFRVGKLEEGASEMRKEVTQGLGEIRKEVQRGNDAHREALQTIAESAIKVETTLSAHIDRNSDEHDALNIKVDEIAANGSGKKNGAVAAGSGVGGGILVVIAHYIKELLTNPGNLTP